MTTISSFSCTAVVGILYCRERKAKRTEMTASRFLSFPASFNSLIYSHFLMAGVGAFSTSWYKFESSPGNQRVSGSSSSKGRVHRNAYDLLSLNTKFSQVIYANIRNSKISERQKL
jgi:hypothetical protein